MRRRRRFRPRHSSSSSAPRHNSSSAPYVSPEKLASVKTIIHRFDNVGDYYRKATASVAWIPEQERHWHQAGNDTFYNSHSKEDMVQRYTKGYPEGTAMANDLILKISPFIRTVKGTRKAWTPKPYAGGNFILDNYVRGLPDLCNTMSSVKSKKFVSIVLNGWASAGVSVPILQMRGAACIALVQALESLNYRVSIKLVYSPKGDFSNPAQLIHIINLKPFEQSMEVDRLAFFLADPCALRRLFFSATETEPDEAVRKFFGAYKGGWYGMPGELPASELKENDLYIGCGDWTKEAWHSLPNAQAWIKETLKRYGVEFYG